MANKTVEVLGTAEFKAGLLVEVPVTLEADYELKVVDEKSFIKTLTKEELEAFNDKDSGRYKDFIRKLLNEAKEQVTKEAESYSSWLEDFEVRDGLLFETFTPTTFLGQAYEVADIYDGEIHGCTIEVESSQSVLEVETDNG